MRMETLKGLSLRRVDASKFHPNSRVFTDSSLFSTIIGNAL